jgi:hypothetical protein
VVKVRKEQQVQPAHKDLREVQVRKERPAPQVLKGLLGQLVRKAARVQQEQLGLRVR